MTPIHKRTSRHASRHAPFRPSRRHAAVEPSRSTPSDPSRKPSRPSRTGAVTFAPLSKERATGSLPGGNLLEPLTKDRRVSPLTVSAPPVQISFLESHA